MIVDNDFKPQLKQTKPIIGHLTCRLVMYFFNLQSSSPDVKMVESGKPLFKLKLRLNSTIYTKVNIDDMCHENRFFI